MKYPVLWGILFPAVVVTLAIPLSNVIIPGVAAAKPATTATLPATASPQATTAGVPPQPASTASPSKPAVAVQAAPAAAAVRTNPPVVAASPDQVQTVQYVDQSRRVIDQVTAPAYTTDASYSIGSLTQDTPALVEGAHVDLVRANCSVCHATTFISSSTGGKTTRTVQKQPLETHTYRYRRYDLRLNADERDASNYLLFLEDERGQVYVYRRN
ncbi:cytochrome c [Deinococcus alpinitundrae]|uniref:cytochrome c n=1 Tax=Deinococcus alpinitundrae TaxID=468913 RepID=UPI00137A9A9B|nr:cytochrome c [Deinococcus alpinitundrae]